MRNPKHDRGAFFVGESEAQCFRCGAEVQGTGGNQVMIEGGRDLTNSPVIHHRLMQQKERRSWRQSKGLRMDGAKSWNELTGEATLGQIMA